MSDNRAHSELGASISHRWIACPGSVALSRGQEQTDNVHAQAGRVAHHVAEECLRYGADADRFLGDMIEVPGAEGTFLEVDEEMVGAVQQFVDYCRRIGGDPNDKFWIEHQFDLSELNPPEPMFGTTDFAIYDADLKQLEIIDLKYGQGVVVEVMGNPQLRYYALGAALSLGKGLEIETIKITIIQPRAHHSDGVVRSETLNYFELLEFAGELLQAAEATQAENAPLNPGPHCRFCPALAICPAQREQVQALAQVAFAEMPVSVPPEPEALPDEVLGDLASKLPILDDWSTAVKRELERRLVAGRGITGFKLVEKRATRRWVDEKEAALWVWREHGLAEAAHDMKLKSPAQIEKMIGKKNLPAELVEKKSSGYKLAPESDPRPALPSGPQHAFAALPPADE